MKRIIRLTESDLTRIVRRVLRESEDSAMAIGDDPKEFHRHSDGGNPGIEKFLMDPLNEAIADELEQQLENDPYAKNTKSNFGKGTGKMMIEFNYKMMSPVEFIDQVQEDAKEGICHTITSYEYNNRLLKSTLIKVRTNEGQCAKAGSSTGSSTKPKKTTKACKHSTKQVVLDNVKGFQRWCISSGNYYAEYTDGSTSKCSKVDGIIGCCTATCYAKTRNKE
jgi:hypothetical protein